MSEATYNDGILEAMAMYSRELEIHEPYFEDDDCPVDPWALLIEWIDDAQTNITKGVWVEYHKGILKQCELLYVSIGGCVQVA